MPIPVSRIWRAGSDFHAVDARLTRADSREMLFARGFHDVWRRAGRAIIRE